MTENPIIWQPDQRRVQATALYKFMHAHDYDDYDKLHRWSTTDLAGFWDAVCEFGGVEFDVSPDCSLERPDNMMDAGWYAGSQLNFAKHLLRHTGNKPALVFCGEDDTRREISRDELRTAVAAFAAGLRQAGTR